MESTVASAPGFLATPLRLTPFAALTIDPARVGDHAAARAFARPYRDVAARLSRWEAQGRIRRDPRPAVYLHEYTANGTTVRGLVGLIDLSRRSDRLETRAILPHEAVYAAQADELAERMVQMRLNPAPILLVHRGPARLRRLLQQIVAGEAPSRQFTDRGGQGHRIWPIRDPERLALVSEEMAVSRPVLADGHHRYAAYLALQSRHPGTGWDRGLAMVIDQDDTPLALGAIHRVLGGVSLPQLGDHLMGSAHHLEICTEEVALRALSPTTLALTDHRAWAVLDLAGESSAVEALHESILTGLSPMPPISYHHGTESALRKARRGRDTAVLMPAVDFDLVHQVVAHDRLLPEKATSFQPKPSVGALMRSLDG